MPPFPLILCGPSGSGKSTLIKRLFSEYPLLFQFSISHTTRKSRQGEQNGREYHFIETQEFERMQSENAFIECARFSGNWYGTSFDAVKAVMASGKNVVLDIERQGVMQLKSQQLPLFSNALFLFIAPPSIEELNKRLIARNTETEESLKARLDAAKDELTWGYTDGSVDKVIVNEDVGVAYSELKKFVGLE